MHFVADKYRKPLFLTVWDRMIKFTIFFYYTMEFSDVVSNSEYKDKVRVEAFWESKIIPAFSWYQESPSPPKKS